ncbi:MAG: hypothetical protein E6R04_09025 [Spirochaetes bacterium]|nr:MAG: hypothetical protein E6R04_09025 [Spirochaetota bacterium]
MAGDKFKRVNAGDSLDISAPTWNGLIDAAEYVAKHRNRMDFNPSAAAFVQSGMLVRVKNASGADVDQYCPLMLSGGSVFDSGGSASHVDSFKKTPLLIGVEPEDDPEAVFVITQEPIADGDFGLCCLFGMTVANVDVTHASHTHATLKGGDLTQLSSAMFGHRIYYKPSGTGAKLAYVSLGHLSGPMWVGVAQATIAPGASGNFKFATGAIGSLTAIGNSFSGTYPAGTSAGSLASGDELLVTRIPGHWLISPVECPAP